MTKLVFEIEADLPEEVAADMDLDCMYRDVDLETPYGRIKGQIVTIDRYERA